MNHFPDLNAMVEKIAMSRKYRDTGIPRQTIEDVLQQELARLPKKSEALRSARAILHNIMAPYLGNPDYAAAKAELAWLDFQANRQVLEIFCRKILACHDSTRERMPYLAEFYGTIRQIIPQPRVILDLACGLNPFSLPFMGLPATTHYHAYDIHQPRVSLINDLFARMGLAELAETRDVLLDPPRMKADAAFLFKEAHRMEKRRKGCSRDLVNALNVRVVFISLPNRSLDGRRDLRQRMDALFDRTRADFAGETGSREFGRETLYWIRKADG